MPPSRTKPSVKVETFAKTTKSKHNILRARTPGPVIRCNECPLYISSIRAVNAHAHTRYPTKKVPPEKMSDTMSAQFYHPNNGILNPTVYRTRFENVVHEKIRYCCIEVFEVVRNI